MTKAKFLCLILLILPLAAWSISFIGVDTGLLFIITTEAAGAPNPVILQGIGMTLPLVEAPMFFLDVGLLFSGCQYMYLNNRAIPADNELANTIWTLFPQLEILVGIPIKFSDSVSMGVGLGPAFVFPLPLFAADSGDAYRSSMFDFFYGKLRLFYGEFELFLRIAIVKGADLRLKVRGLYALSTLWDDPAVNRWNGLQIQGLVSIEAHL